MAPFLGFSSWAAFAPCGHVGVMGIGDGVLLEDAVDRATSDDVDGGRIERTIADVSVRNRTLRFFARAKNVSVTPGGHLFACRRRQTATSPRPGERSLETWRHRTLPDRDTLWHSTCLGNGGAERETL